MTKGKMGYVGERERTKKRHKAGERKERNGAFIFYLPKILKFTNAVYTFS